MSGRPTRPPRDCEDRDRGGDAHHTTRQQERHARAGLIRCERESRFRIYSLDFSKVDALIAFLTAQIVVCQVDTIAAQFSRSRDWIVSTRGEHGGEPASLAPQVRCLALVYPSPEQLDLSIIDVAAHVELERLQLPVHRDAVLARRN